MKAIRIYEFGEPEVMKIVEVERPVPAADEILVKVYAASVNPADYIIRRGGNEGLKKLLKLPMGLGIDGAGIVEEVGSEVTLFKKRRPRIWSTQLPGRQLYRIHGSKGQPVCPDAANT